MLTDQMIATEFYEAGQMMSEVIRRVAQAAEAATLQKILGVISTVFESSADTPTDHQPVVKKKRPMQYCPVPGCKNVAAAVFGMTCKEHAGVAKSKIAKYRKDKKLATAKMSLTSTYGKKSRKPRAKVFCPVPGCKNVAAPIFGMVCGDHKTVAKSKIAKYRRDRKAGVVATSKSIAKTTKPRTKTLAKKAVKTTAKKAAKSPAKKAVKKVAIATFNKRFATDRTSFGESLSDYGLGGESAEAERSV